MDELFQNTKHLEQILKDLISEDGLLPNYCAPVSLPIHKFSEVIFI